MEPHPLHKPGEYAEAKHPKPVAVRLSSSEVNHARGLSGRYRAIALSVALIAACSSHAKQSRVVAKGIAMRRCVVDDKYIYADSAEELSRIDRATGVVERLTNDFYALREILLVEGTLYFLDSAGVHSWPPGATTRTTIATFKKRGSGSSLTRFGDRVCWGLDDENSDGHASVDCFEVADHTVARWVTVDGVSLFAAALGDRLYGAVYTGSCVIFDLTNPKATKELGVFPVGCSMFAVTPGGPAMVNSGIMERDHQVTLWMTEPQVHHLVLPDNALRLSSFGPHTYLLMDAGPAQIDLATGALTPIPGAIGYALCGDSKHLYVAGADKTILELPNQ